MSSVLSKPVDDPEIIGQSKTSIEAIKSSKLTRQTKSEKNLHAV
jgi:hypothetical protein